MHRIREWEILCEGQFLKHHEMRRAKLLRRRGTSNGISTETVNPSEHSPLTTDTMEESPVGFLSWNLHVSGPFLTQKVNNDEVRIDKQ